MLPSAHGKDLAVNPPMQTAKTQSCKRVSACESRGADCPGAAGSCNKCQTHPIPSSEALFSTMAHGNTLAKETSLKDSLSKSVGDRRCIATNRRSLADLDKSKLSAATVSKEIGQTHRHSCKWIRSNSCRGSGRNSHRYLLRWAKPQ